MGRLVLLMAVMSLATAGCVVDDGRPAVAADAAELFVLPSPTPPPTVTGVVVREVTGRPVGQTGQAWRALDRGLVELVVAGEVVGAMPAADRQPARAALDAAAQMVADAAAVLWPVVPADPVAAGLVVAGDPTAGGQPVAAAEVATVLSAAADLDVDWWAAVLTPAGRWRDGPADSAQRLVDRLEAAGVLQVQLRDTWTQRWPDRDVPAAAAPLPAGVAATAGGLALAGLAGDVGVGGWLGPAADVAAGPGWPDGQLHRREVLLLLAVAALDGASTAGSVTLGTATARMATVCPDAPGRAAALAEAVGQQRWDVAVSAAAVGLC